MRFSLLKYRVEPGKAYMLRDDGKLILCGMDISYMHPYFILKEQISNIDNMLELLASNEEEQYVWLWLYKYVNKETQKAFAHLVSQLITYAEQNSLEYASEVLKDLFSIKPAETITENLFSEALEVNDMINKQFCKVRIGDKFRSIKSGDSYFRICPSGFNWFNYIWQIVYDNRNVLETVTICKDKASCGEDTCYLLHGESLDRMPIDDFINISGNPVVESLDENQ